MDKTERGLRENFDSLLALSKKESCYLAAFEALGKTIEELKCEVRSKDYQISVLERRLEEEMRRNK